MNPLSFINWNVSPEIFSIGGVHVRWYGLLFALSFVVGYQLISWMFRREQKPQRAMDSLTIWMIVGTVVGARLGHCLFYEPAAYLQNPVEILMIWKGGLASHGAAIGIIISIYYFSKKYQNLPMLWTLDRLVVVVALAGFFIRLGNLFNSEIYGHPTDLPWGVVFPSFADPSGLARHPSQVYESIAYLFFFAILLRVYLKNYKTMNNGYLLSLFLVLIFGARFLIEFTKEGQASFDDALPITMGQILSIPFVCYGVYLYLKTKKQKTEGA